MNSDVNSFLKKYQPNPRNVTDLQYKIMLFVDFWVRKEKTPVPHREILSKMFIENLTPEQTTFKSIASLVKKGYLRKSGSNRKRVYVQLRRV